MLKEVTIKNFKSFNEEATFSMEAAIDRVSEHSNHIMKINNNNILRITSIYGANGSGKSNLIKVLRLPALLLTGNKIDRANDELACIYSSSKVIEEAIFFINNEFELGYSFRFSYDTNSSNEIVLNIINEEVSFKENGSQSFIELFYRDEEGHIDSSISTKLKIEKLSPKLSAIAKLYNDYANTLANDDIEARAIRALYSEITAITCLCSNNSHYDPSLIARYKSKLISGLSNLDIAISDILVNGNNGEIYLERQVNINGAMEGRRVALKNESNGIKKLFDILYSIIVNANKPRVYYADDLPSSLHPRVLKAIIEVFTDNNFSSQLIYTAHDTAVMTNELFRRDEIWFTYNDKDYSTKLISLDNIVNYKGEQVRKDAKYNKQYLEGRYGAVPIIKGFNNVDNL